MTAHPHCANRGGHAPHQLSIPMVGGVGTTICEGRAVPDDELAELKARIARTLDYTDALLRLPGPDSTVAIIARAVHQSLTTPIR